MKKSFITSIAAIAALMAIAAPAAAQSYQAANAGSISNQTQAHAAVNGNGTAYSVAKGAASAIAHGGVSTSALPGHTGQQQALTGDVATTVTGQAYNIGTGSGVGSALSAGEAAASVNGWTAFSRPNQQLHMAGDTSSTASGAVVASTSRDGFFGASSTAGFAVSGYVGSAPIPGGPQIVGGVTDTKYSTADAGAGGVTFEGGTPAGQSAATRYGDAAGNASVSAWFTDPAGQ